MNDYENVVLVSYAWGGESEHTVDELERAFAARSINIMRDKKDIDYKDSFEMFEQYIGRGQCVVIVISDKYLRSEHCMHELVEVDKNREMRSRIFPIVLADARIYKAVDRLSYIKYWDQQIEQFNQAIKQIDMMTNLASIAANLEKYVLIRANFDRLIALLSDMNALTPDVHTANGFSTLIGAVEYALAEKSQVKTKQVKLILEGNFDEFTLNRQQATIDVLAALLKIAPTDIRVSKVSKGSIILTIELPESAANHLYEMAIRRDSKIISSGIKSVILDGREIIQQLPIMQKAVLENTRYWLRVLQATPSDRKLPDEDFRGAVKAMDAVLRFPDLWDVTYVLAQALHPYMEQRGQWADWDDCLQVLVDRARLQADPQAEAVILLRRAGIQRQRGDFKGATFSCYGAWQLYRRMKNQIGLANIFSQLGDVYRQRGKTFRAEILCLRAVRLFDDGEHKDALAQAENRLGLVYFGQLRHSDALSHFLRAELLWRETNNPHGLGKVLQNLGELYRLTKDFEKALAYLEQSIQYYLMTGDEISAARTRLNVGNIYLNQMDWQRAERTYLQAEIVLKHEGDSLELATARHNLGIVYIHLEDWDEAEDCFLRSLEQWRSRGDIWREANTLGEIGSLHMARGAWADAKNALDIAWGLLDGHAGAYFDLLRQELAGRRKKLVF